VEITSEGNDNCTITIHKAPSRDFDTNVCKFEEGIIKVLLEAFNGGKWKVRTVKAEGEDCVIEATKG